jgi:hypothetical protein
MKTDTGYCDTCHALVDLTDDGRLARHGYAAPTTSNPGSRMCVRTGTRPDPLPDTSEVAGAVFKEAAPPGHCPVCGTRNLMIVREGFYVRHEVPGAEPLPCRGSYTEVVD